MPRTKREDPFLRALNEQSDWRTAQDPLAEALAKAFGIEALPVGDNFERRDMLELAAALRRSLPRLRTEHFIAALDVITDQIERGIYQTPRAAFYTIVGFIRAQGIGFVSSAQAQIQADFERQNPNARRMESHGFSGTAGDDEI